MVACWSCSHFWMNSYTPPQERFKELWGPEAKGTSGDPRIYQTNHNVVAVSCTKQLIEFKGVLTELLLLWTCLFSCFPVGPHSARGTRHLSALPTYSMRHPRCCCSAQFGCTFFFCCYCWIPPPFHWSLFTTNISCLLHQFPHQGLRTEININATVIRWC